MFHLFEKKISTSLLTLTLLSTYSFQILWPFHNILTLNLLPSRWLNLGRYFHFGPILNRAATANLSQARPYILPQFFDRLFLIRGHSITTWTTLTINGGFQLLDLIITELESHMTNLTSELQKKIPSAVVIYYCAWYATQTLI